MATRAGAVNDAGDSLALAGDDRYDEALVADSDVALLQHAFFLVRAQESLERIVDRFLLLLDLATQPGQRHAGVIGDCAIGQDLAGEILKHRSELADRQGSGAQA